MGHITNAYKPPKGDLNVKVLLVIEKIVSSHLSLSCRYLVSRFLRSPLRHRANNKQSAQQSNKSVQAQISF